MHNFLHNFHFTLSFQSFILSLLLSSISHTPQKFLTLKEKLQCEKESRICGGAEFRLDTLQKMPFRRTETVLQSNELILHDLYVLALHFCLSNRKFRIAYKTFPFQSEVLHRDFWICSLLQSLFQKWNILL